MQGRNLLTLFGPTASGKSGLAMALAAEINGTIINADSRQVYKHMPLITACPSKKDYATHPHKLFEYLEPTERLSAGTWAESAAKAIEETWGQGRTPIVVGGTGFYLKTLLEGISPMPPIPPKAEELFANLPPEELAEKLHKADPTLYQTLKTKNELSNPQRMVRALAVQAHTGVPLSAWQTKPGIPFIKAEKTLKIALNPPLPHLHHTIEKRWHTMLKEGLLEEMQNLQNRGFPTTAPGLQGLAIEPFFQHLNGTLSLQEALAAGIQSHKTYAKRQRTWLRTQYKADITLETPTPETILATLC